MGLTLATLLFFAIVLAWIVLPFVPALREARDRRDAEPLRVVKESEVDVRHFARGFRRFLDTRLGEAQTRCRDQGATVEGTLPGGERFIVLPAGAAAAGVPGLSLAPCDAVLIGCGDLDLPEKSVLLREVGAGGSLSAGAHSLFRAVIAERNIRFGTGSQLLRWAHAGEAVVAEKDCELYGRISAEREIRLDVGCRFERMHAARVRFGPGGAAADPPAVTAPAAAHHEAVPLEPSDVPGVKDVSAGRWWIAGNLNLPAGACVEADLVVTGHAHVGEGARVIGSIKAHRGLTLGARVEVTGSVVCRSDVTVGRDCRIGGPLISETTLTIGAGSVIGSAGRPTTVSAWAIVAEPGTSAHGTVWAHANGEVRAHAIAGDQGARARGAAA